MTSQNPLAVTPRAFKFMTNLFEFPFMNARTFFAEKSLQPNINDKMKAGFSQFLKCLKLYQEEFDISIAQDDNVTIYGSVTLENGAIVRAVNNFHRKAWFSNISVRMDSEELFDYSSDQGICYGQVDY